MDEKMFSYIRILIAVLCVHNSIQASIDSLNYSIKDKMTLEKIIKNRNIRESDTENKQLKQFSHIDPKIDEDARLSVPQLITKYGYKAEVHYVTTEDGYIIQLHRIAGGAKSPPRMGKQVVYSTHGLSDSSAEVVLSGPNHALGYLLADNDYDVWLGNARGNIYSANHTTLDPFGSLKDRDRFWQFSWHEIGYFDMPASIDYILAQTGQSKLQYIGYSQGATSFFVLMSERPEYNEKIEMMHGLAPAIFLSHTKSPSVRAIIPFLPVAQRLKELVGAHFISPSKEFRVMAGELLCRDRVRTQIICENLLFLDMGYESDQLNGTLLPVILGQAAGAATNQFLHYGQEVQSGHFRQYDHGPVKNLLKYKRSTPPDYNLQNVKVPVAVYHSQNDWLVTPKDVNILLQKLPNVIKHYLVPHKKFNHIDFLWGIDAPTLLFNEILNTMKSSNDYYYDDDYSLN